jgi:hypothetical protein
MQVSQALESDNFAVMGGGKARAFQIGQSAHAFKILSDALYSDKFKAVVREVTCNAIDAHIAAGKADKPIDITLNGSELIFRDYGHGISDENIVPVFATYFGSTKTNDETQTGGFGLGSKSPFAYNDHFTVISRHAGMQRVYAVYIADDETGGAPAVKLMAPPVATTERGMTITIPLVQAEDRYSFQAHINQIVQDGGMKVRLNNHLLPTTDYTELRKETIGEFNASYNQRGHIFLLYGNVVYPVGENSEIDDLRGELKEYITGHSMFVLNAPPSSLTVTPSREAISYSPRTVKTVNALMKKALGQIRTSYEKKLADEVKRLVEQCPRNEVPGIWLTRKELIADGKALSGGRAANSGAEIGANAALRSIYGDGRYFSGHTRDKIIGRILKRAARFHKTQRKTLLGIDIQNNFETRQSNLKFLGRKVLRIAKEMGITGPQYVRLTDSTLSLAKKPGKGRYHSYVSLNTIVIAPSRERALATTKTGFYLIIPKLDDAAAAKLTALCRLHGFDYAGQSHTILDNPTHMKPKVKKIKKVVVVDPDKYPALSTCIMANRPRTGSVLQIGKPTISKPTAFFAIHITKKSNTYNHETIDPARGVVALRDWVKDYMPDVVIVRNETTYEKLVKAGVPRLQDVLLKEIEDYISAHPNNFKMMLDVIGLENGLGYSEADQLYKGLLRCGPRGAALVLNVSHTPTPEDERIFTLLRFVDAILGATPIPAWLRTKEYAERGAAGHKRLEEILTVSVPGRRRMTPKIDAPYLKFYSQVLDYSNLNTSLDEEARDRLFQMMEADMKAYQLTKGQP